MGQDVGTRYAKYVSALKTAVFDSPGAVSGDMRRAIAARRVRELPAALGPYTEKVALHAYRVTDEDVAALTRAGYSDDEIFEATAAAALGAALMRLDRAMGALRDSPDLRSGAR